MADASTALVRTEASLADAKRKREALVDCLEGGASPYEAAQELAIPIRQVLRWMGRTDVRKAAEAGRRIRLAALRARMIGLGDEGADIVSRIMHDPTVEPEIRLKAAEDAMLWSIGRPSATPGPDAGDGYRPPPLALQVNVGGKSERAVTFQERLAQVIRDDEPERK
ncbi:MAG: hypothetical protein QME96_06600 [Myxococcota bacterium]|nr:hypothetical protein [Myxococcota bacterium]